MFKRKIKSLGLMNTVGKNPQKTISTLNEVLYKRNNSLQLSGVNSRNVRVV